VGYAQSFIIPVPGETQADDQRLFHGFKLKGQREQLVCDPQFAPTCTDLDRDLIGAPDLLLPTIQRCKGDLTHNGPRGSVGQRESILWLLSYREQQLMLSFGKAGKGA
jgi:hypothetical protein